MIRSIVKSFAMVTVQLAASLAVGTGCAQMPNGAQPVPTPVVTEPSDPEANTNDVLRGAGAPGDSNGLTPEMDPSDGQDGIPDFDAGVPGPGVGAPVPDLGVPGPGVGAPVPDLGVPGPGVGAPVPDLGVPGLGVGAPVIPVPYPVVAPLPIYHDFYDYPYGYPYYGKGYKGHYGYKKYGGYGYKYDGGHGYKKYGDYGSKKYGGHGYKKYGGYGGHGYKGGKSYGKKR